MAVGNLFERLEQQRLADEPEKERPPEIIPATNLKLLPVGRFLNWLLNSWDEPTISACEIYTYGPVSVRNPKEAIHAAEILVQHGWLTPLRAHRHDRKLWLINRENKPTGIPRVNQTTATSADPSGTIVSRH
jgi:hypothetical protein